MPRGAIPRVVNHQFGQITVWYQVDPEAQKVQRGLAVVGTGEDINPAWTYVGMAFVGAFVWHVFEEPAA